MELQKDFNYEEECEGSSDEIPVDECPVAVEQKAFQFGFGSSKPDRNGNDNDPIITIIDRSGVHEIGVRWCCCPDALECDM